MDDSTIRPSRRDLLTLIGLAAGSSAMLGAMTELGFARQSPYAGPIKLEGRPERGNKVLVLGAGLAGMTAALELRKAGYNVRILEYQKRGGGRCWSLRGGDKFTELGGHTQTVDFAEGSYVNPGPWRIPHHHLALLDYCQRLGVALEVYIQENQNAYIHSVDAFDGKPQRYAKIYADYIGHISELLAKATNQGALDDRLKKEEQEMLLELLRKFGILDQKMRYVESVDVSEYRGWEVAPGGGVSGEPEPSKPMRAEDILSSGFWQYLRNHTTYRHHAPMFQPIGGMDKIAAAFERVVGDLITFNAKVTKIVQNSFGVKVTYQPAEGEGKEEMAEADWCVCTIPYSILGQIEADFSADMRAVMTKLAYHGGFKAGLEFKRRFWEEDEQICGGITYTDLPIAEIAYPANDMFTKGPGVLLGAYVFGPRSFRFNSMTPEERLQMVRDYGARIHPKYEEEYRTGVSVTWHRIPWTLGCYGMWQDKETDYPIAVKMDRRIVCAGEHLSYIPGWQEGAILSSLDAIKRLHERAMEGLHAIKEANQ